MTNAALSTQIETAERQVSTDSYDMSVGELINIYRDGEISINPEYQRLFRWNIEQKSSFIESLLLGIPIPPIFVIETEARVWELIDGLQRTSTILQFVGELKGPDDGALIPPVPLVGGRHLTQLDGIAWREEEAAGPQFLLGNAERIRLKRAKISIQILRRTSDQTSKYDLFQRLNSGGTKANRQELRNCMVVMQDPSFLTRLRASAHSEPFTTLFRFSPNQMSEQVDIEYINRAAVLASWDIGGNQDVEDFFDDRTLDLIKGENDHRTHILDNVDRTFELIANAGGDRALHKPGRDGQPAKPPKNSALEAIVVGIARNLEAINALPDPVAFVRGRLADIWEENVMRRAASSGVSGTTRLRLTVPFGAAWFTPQ
ncbi:DUF262 domain-containing protein [Microcoleus sp. LEGE 07076]|uniref:DUF262 domain-containing protein n=1 Tax=Microcoleus sp. LEGE 07076 TaxID=915322 RepID=UPI00187E6891|nr:DUF262 domain-containing protein [Microcoleus sp. LEGE 07076]MBE9188671.1 DUF262 domain-containing protein [Microcoleus sp. LEGE 07076]